jgi:glycine betaine/proline transport system substrate-binding protein
MSFVFPGNRAILAAAASACLLSAGSALAQSSEPIRIALNDWTGQHISSRIMGGVLERAGYGVAYVEADYLGQFAQLERGDLTVAMEIWATTGAEALDAAIATGNVVNLGETGLVAKEEWWFPGYMAEKCPGLPDWQALKTVPCAEAFATPETAPKGYYLAGPADWGGFDAERIAALGLPFAVAHARDEEELFSSLAEAYKRRAPIMLWLYSPHWAPAFYDGDWVAFPAYQPRCYSDPSWGVNPGAKYDCGKPSGPIWKAAWAGIEDKWPGASKAISKFALGNDEMDAMLIAVERDGKTVAAVVADWLDANESRWRRWLE